MRRLIVQIFTAFAITSPAAFASDRALPASRNNGFEQLLNTSCSLRLLPALGDYVAAEINFPEQASFFYDFSLRPVQEGFENPFAKVIRESQNGGPNSNPNSDGEGLHKAELELRATTDSRELRLYSQTRRIYSWSLTEPIVDIRYISDYQTGKSNLRNEGFLSVHGWTKVRYYRLTLKGLFQIPQSIFERERGNRLPGIELRPRQFTPHFSYDKSNRMIFQFSPPGLSRSYPQLDADTKWKSVLRAAGIEINDRLFHEDVNYVIGKKNEFNRLVDAQRPRLAGPLPLYNHSEWIIDSLLIANLRKAEPVNGEIFPIAFGKLAEAIRMAARARQKCSDEVLNPKVENYPTLFLRLATAALRKYPMLQETFAYTVNRRDSGVQLRTVNSGKNVGFVLSGVGGCPDSFIHLADNAIKDPVFLSVGSMLPANSL